MLNQGTAEQRYSRLEPDREPFLTRARDCSKLTIPSLMPPEGNTGSSYFHSPYQSVGAKGIKNLASSLLLTLMPPNDPFFRLTVPASLEDEIKEIESRPGGETFRTDLDRTLAKVERQVQSAVESGGDRSDINEAFLHLLNEGNVLLTIFKEDTRVYHLDSYVCRRDRKGTLLELIIKETASLQSLPDDFVEKITPRLKKASADSGKDREVELYTRVWRDGNWLHSRQEVAGGVVPGSEGKYKPESSPFIALRFAKVSGQSYGRSYVEEFYGDLLSLEGLTRAIVESSAAAAKTLFMVDPNSITEIEDLTTAENLEFVTGSSTDVSVLRMDKTGDFSVARATADAIESRLEEAFLMRTSIQRDAERVTAEEIRYMAGEIDDGLGGLFSLLAQEFQLPYIKRKMDTIAGLPKLPSLGIEPVIITGLEALGRGQDLRKVERVMLGMAQVFGAESVASRANFDVIVSRYGAALGADLSGLFKTQQQLQMEAQQAQIAQAAAASAPGVAQELTKGAVAARQTPE